MKKLVMAIVLTTVLTVASFAQTDKAGKFGIGIDDVNSPNLAVKYFFSDKVASEFLVGFNLYSPGGDAPAGYTKVTGTDFRVGLSLLYHFSAGDFSPYVGVDGLFETNKTGGFYSIEPDAKNSVQANLVIGGEYFIAKQFSVGLKEKLGVDIKLSRDVPKEETDLYMNTSTVVTARFYFN
jgi:outer membrane protein W